MIFPKIVILSRYKWIYVFFFSTFLGEIIPFYLLIICSYKVWSVTPANEKQLQAIRKWEQFEGVDFWEASRRASVEQRIMIAPEIQNSFAHFLVDYNITNELIINNVERYNIHKQNSFFVDLLNHLYSHTAYSKLNEKYKAFKAERKTTMH